MYREGLLCGKNPSKKLLWDKTSGVADFEEKTFWESYRPLEDLQSVKEGRRLFDDLLYGKYPAKVLYTETPYVRSFWIKKRMMTLRRSSVWKILYNVPLYEDSLCEVLLKISSIRKRNLDGLFRMKKTYGRFFVYGENFWKISSKQSGILEVVLYERGYLIRWKDSSNVQS